MAGARRLEISGK